MMKKFLMILVVCPMVWTYGSKAQKVIRKGMPPVNSKTSSRTVFYNISQLTGKWQEYQRKIVGTSAPVDFQDTLMLSFNKRDSVYIYDGISMSQRGVASIDAPASLSMAGDTYSILSMNKTNMVLNDGEYIRSFKKMKQFYRETLGNIQLNTESFEKPQAINPGNLQGRWDVYRRQANPGTADSVMVKSITFKTTTNESIAGSISFYSSGNTQTENFTGYISGTMMHLTAPGFKGSWQTYKADGKEFVFGKDKEIIYYARKF